MEGEREASMQEKQISCLPPVPQLGMESAACLVYRTPPQPTGPPGQGYISLRVDRTTVCQKYIQRYNRKYDVLTKEFTQRVAGPLLLVGIKKCAGIVNLFFFKYHSG